ncbi:multiple sugar transport system substrate-binding protein [Haloactinopolyspora alba]|uniref:Multiple sugar transport system substrate-binding protein n=1 Tax=Haloactinopolyspora alba TaxID=648780 RepID=A0A2P8DT78_9ACTN|nr:extracellular solute-binding protein [Haloactinopolyspora alba]PSL00405.1 multiple sugar transport system substrate-binding protein [Haloactinopolyspora alba]
MRRTTMAAGALAMALPLAACGSDSGSASGDGEISGTVTMWTNPIYDENAMREHYQQQAAEFQKEHPDVEVEITVNPWQGAQEQLTAALAAGEGPDVAYLIPDRIPTLASQDLLAPLGDTLGQDRDDFHQSALDAVTYEDEIYAIPVLQSVIPQVYDKRVLDAAGVAEPPTTWDAFLDAAEKVKQAGHYMTEYPGHLEMTLNISFYPWLYQAGGSVYSDDGESVAFNSPEGIEALEYLKTLVDEGYTPKGAISEPSNIEQSEVSRGNVAMVSAEPQRLIELWGAENVLIAPPLENQEQVAYGTVGAYGVLGTSDNTAAAREWVKWISRPEALREFDVESGYFAPRKSLDDLYADDPVLGKVEKLIPTTSTFGPHPAKSVEVMSTLRVEVQAALLGEKSPEEALAAAEEQANRILGGS